jgi:hypothetical protein
MEDAEFASRAATTCLLHYQIGELLTEHQLHEIMDQFATRSPHLRQDLLNKALGATSITTKEIHRERPRSRFNRSHAIAFAVAIAMVAVPLALWHFHRQSIDAAQSSQPSAASVSKQESKPRVATLTQLKDPVWAAGGPHFHHGEPLLQGTRIALQSGMAKVTFDCGAEVVLEGPCDFIIREPMLGFLKSGKITADVPRRAFSFAILSPKVDFVDLGTSFGLNVGDEGHAELHVFRGEVLCSQASGDEKNQNTVYHVTANKAVEFQPGEGVPTDIAMNEQQFSEHIDLRHGRKEFDGELPPGKLALWLSADTGVVTDSHQGVISWRDILYGDNQSGEDAIQVEELARPHLVPDALAGKPAIRFDGKADYLLTTPLATTDDQTVAFVCQFSPNATDKSRRWGGQILNYDGPPSRYLSDTLEPGVLQIGEPLLEKEFKPTLFSAQVFAGFIGSATVESGRVDAMPVGVDVPIVVSYRYDLSNSRATLTMNGKKCGESRAYAPQAITSRKIIGRHAWMQNFFHGDLAELLIYNKALSPKELAETTSYLAKKYSIPFESDLSAPHEVSP